MNHILDCLNRFKSLQHQDPVEQPSTSAPAKPSVYESPFFPSDPPPEPPELLNLYAIDEKLSPFDHDIQYLPPRAHDFPCLATLTPYPLLFQNDALNLAISCVLLFLDNPDYEWFHVSIRIPAYTRFVELVEANSNCIRIIPFSCWCDGGEEPQTQFRQHRHLIVACTRPDYFLNNVWRKIKILKRDKPSASYKALFYTRIQAPRHLVNTILYVSKRQSQCKFASKKQPKRNNHFYLSESLTREYALPLVLLWDDGIYELIQLTTLKLNRFKLVTSPHLIRDGAKSRMLIKHIPELPLNLVLPVDRSMEPCGYETDYKLHLMNGQKMYFHRNEELEWMEGEAWVQRQADRGNLFYHVVGEKFWTPHPFQQGLINDFKPIADSSRERKEKMEQMEENMALLRRDFAAKESEWKAKELEWKAKELEWREKESEWRAKELEWKAKELEWREKELEWRKTKESLQIKENELLAKINDMNKDEISRLKQEFLELKTEVLNLRQENSNLKQENSNLRQENLKFRQTIEELRQIIAEVEVRRVK